jgi:CO/xanthine dehydrogenase Mo-binding subunit
VQLSVGLARYVEITGLSLESGGPKEIATVKVHADGSATILTGISPHGQGHATVWAMLAREELGIPVEAITVKWGDTDVLQPARSQGHREAGTIGATPAVQNAITGALAHLGVWHIGMPASPQSHRRCAGLCRWCRSAWPCLAWPVRG